MGFESRIESLDDWIAMYPEKFAEEEIAFNHIRRGDHIFIASGCGEPQYLVDSMVRYVQSRPKAFFDTGIVHVYSFGIAPYTDPKFKSNFRLNSFFVGNNNRESINQGMADYTPISLSDLPALIRRGSVRIDVALVQTCLPDEHGFMSLGVSVDIVKAAMDKASMIIAQVNANMPRVHGDGFIHIKDVNFIIRKDQPLLELPAVPLTETTKRIGKYVGVLFFDDSHCGWGACLFLGRRSTKLKGLTRSPQATNIRFVRKVPSMGPSIC